MKQKLQEQILVLKFFFAVKDYVTYLKLLFAQMIQKKNSCVKLN